MAKTNDMPELHSVKVFVTKNTPPRRRHCIANTSNAGKNSSHGFIGYFIASCFIAKDLSLIFAGGQAHV
ncbi:hypothetical protein SG34_013255 [Thalassomonas viridans]|uniref:Uncharacterized protein n=1 Tax=Thalassomonas viridans TaxID=137584 RepID=A0AAF0CCB9_9GAMM|nr:hypothetical protein [Thalassomonas viridans]WDE07770.1 hypothetical protein SG34_013255 [Thalassomonas viridans]